MIYNISTYNVDSPKLLAAVKENSKTDRDTVQATDASCKSTQ